MSRRGLALVTGLGIALAGAGWAWSAGALTIGAATGTPEPSAAPSVKTVSVERRTLQVTEDLDGTLGFDGSASVPASTAGTLTWLPIEGSTVGRGKPTQEIDGKRTGYLMIGNRPAWRSFEPGMSNGADVLQLEQNLKALGFGGHGMTVDSHWTSATTAAVKRWQRANHLTADGSIDRGEIVFLPATLRVTEHASAVGDSVGPGAPVLRGTTTRQVVTIQLDASKQDLVEVGAPVTVELPDGSTTNGHVAAIGRVAQSSDSGGGDSTPTIKVTVTLDDAKSAGSLDQAPVTVHVVSDAHENVLAVPVDALVALLEGGYAVEVKAADGSRHYVGVHTGLFADGYVEITGTGLKAGDLVVVPS